MIINNASKENEDNIVYAIKPDPEKGTLEYIFIDYPIDPFFTILINPTETAGNEKW